MPKIPPTPKVFEVEPRRFETHGSLPTEDVELDDLALPSFAVVPDPADSTATVAGQES